MQTIERLIKRFEQHLKVIKYNETTKEIFILNWHKYNWTKSPKVMGCIVKELKEIKNSTFKQILYN